MLRVTLAIRGDMEEYVREEMKKSGLSASMCCLNLAISGKEYRESLRGITFLADVLKEQQMKETKGHEKVQSSRTRSMA